MTAQSLYAYHLILLLWQWFYNLQSDFIYWQPDWLYRIIIRSSLFITDSNSCLVVKRLLITAYMCVQLCQAECCQDREMASIMSLLCPQTPFRPRTSKYTGLPSLLVADPMTVTCCLWPDTQSYHSNAETVNRLPKSSSVSGRQDSSIGFYSNRVYVVWIAFLMLTSQLFSHLKCPKLFRDVMSSNTVVDGEPHADD